jgi:hypothetical protein
MLHRLRRSVIALPLFLGLALPAAAADADGKETPSELMTEAMSRMVRALEMMIQSIPQYEKPEITEDGDIIIRRKNPETSPDTGPEERKGPHRLPDPRAPKTPEKGRTI